MTEKRHLQITAALRDTASAGFSKMLTAARTVSAGIAKAFKAAVGVFASLTAAGVGAFVAIKRAANDLDKVAKIVDNLGLTAESLTAVAHAADLAGISFEDLSTSLRLFEKVVGEASTGGARQREILAQLGLTAEQFAGKQLDVVDVIAKVADGMQGVGDAATKTKILLELFGRSGSQMGALIKDGGAGVRALAAEAKTLGIVFSREELARVEEFNDSWTRLTKTFGSLLQRITIELAPAFTVLFDELRKVFLENADSIRDAFFSVIVVFIEGFKVLDKVFQSIRLSVQGWQLLIHSLSKVTAQLLGMDDAAAVLEQRIQSQISLISQLRDGSDATAEALDKLAERMRNLRDSGSGAPVGGAPVDLGAVRDENQEVEVAPNAWDKFLEGAKKAKDAWTDFNQAAYESGALLVNGPLSALEDTLAAGIAKTKTWKEAFKDFGRQVVQILAQVIAKLLIVRTMQALFGGFGGGGGETFVAQPQALGGTMRGGVTGLKPLRRFAMGGVVRQPTLAIVGEGAAPAEAFVPLPDGRSIPVSFRGGAGGGDVHVNISAMDGADVVRVLRRNRNVLRELHGDDVSRRNFARNQIKRAAR